MFLYLPEAEAGWMVYHKGRFEDATRLGVTSAIVHVSWCVHAMLQVLSYSAVTFHAM